MSQTVTLTLAFKSNQATAALREFSAYIKRTMTEVTESINTIGEDLNGLRFDPRGIVSGASEVESAMAGVTRVIEDTRAIMAELQSKSGAATRGLKSMAGQATATDAKLTTLAGTSAAVGRATQDMASAAGKADMALDGLDEGAAVAGKSIAGLGRATAAALPRLEALSASVFDPAGIVAGSDEAVLALDRVKLAATEARGAVRSAGSGGFSMLPAGGGAALAGGLAKGEKALPGTFRQGLGAGASAALDLGGGAAAMTTILAAVTGKMSANFQDMMQGVRGNTTMTGRDASEMSRETLREMRSGTDATEAAQGYKHISNFGYHGRAASMIANFGNRFGIATHTPVEEIDDTLAGVMNAYRHMGPEMVSRVGNTLHFAAAGSNMDVKDLERNSSRTVGLAANYMGPEGLPDVLAAYSALVQHRINPARADTQVAGMLGQIAAPSNKALGEAKRLGLENFNADGLRRVQLLGVLNEVKGKIGGLPENDQAAALKNLFNNKQGGIGATFLTGAASATYNTALNDPRTGTRAAFAGKTNAIDPAYAQQMSTANQAVKALVGTIKAELIPVGAKMAPLFLAAIPIIKAMADGLKTLLDGFAKLPKPVQEAVLAIGGFKILTSFLPLLSGFSLVSEKTSALIGGLGKAMLGMAPAAAEGAAGVEGAAVVMSGPFALGIAAVVAGIALLTVAWTKDWGGIREFTAGLVKDVVGFFKKNMPEIRETVRTVLATIQQFWAQHGQRILAILTPLWNIVKDVFTNALHLIENIVKLAMDVINGHWAAAGNDLMAIVENLWNVLASLFTNGVKAVGNTLTLLVSLIWDLAKHVVVAAWGLGKSIVDGIVNGIKAGAGAVGQAALGLANSAIISVKGALDIHSPSRVMHKLGENTAQGLAEGILAGLPGVTSAMRQLTKAALAEADPIRARLMIEEGGRRFAKAGDDKTLVADWRGRSLAAITERQQAGRKGSRAEQKMEAGEHAADARLSRQTDAANAARADMAARLETLTGDPDELAADREIIAAKRKYAERLQALGGDSYGPYTKQQQGDFAKAAQERDLTIAAVNAKTQSKADTAEDSRQSDLFSAGDISLTQYDSYLSAREALQDKDSEQYAAYAKKRTELAKQVTDANRQVSQALLEATDPVAAQKSRVQYERDESVRKGADPAQADLLLQAQLTEIDNQAADAREAYLRETNQVSLADYRAYLVKRRDAYAQSSQEYMDLDRQVYETDEELQRKQLDALKQLFEQKKITLEQYQALLSQMLAAVPASSPVHDDIAETQSGLTKQSDQAGVGGVDFWSGIVKSASEQASEAVRALLSPKDKKDAFKAFWRGLRDSVDSSLQGELTKVFQDVFTKIAGSLIGGSSNGGGGLLGGLFGSKNSSGSNAGGAGIAGLLGHGSLLGGILGHGGLGGLFAHGGLFTSGGALGGLGAALPWIGGGALLNSLLGNPFGKLFKHFHLFAAGGLVPGSGNTDSVPALLTPGEFVLSKEMIRNAFTPRIDATRAFMASPGQTPLPGQFGASPNGRSVLPGSLGAEQAQFTVHQYGDHIYHGEMDIADAKREWSRSMERDRRAGRTPSPF